jgi:hypothetical protein
VGTVLEHSCIDDDEHGGARGHIIVMILSALMLTTYPHHGVVAEVDPACAAPAPSAAVERLYFSGPAGR